MRVFLLTKHRKVLVLDTDAHSQLHEEVAMSKLEAVKRPVVMSNEDFDMLLKDMHDRHVFPDKSALEILQMVDLASPEYLFQYRSPRGLNFYEFEVVTMANFYARALGEYFRLCSITDVYYHVAGADTNALGIESILVGMMPVLCRDGEKRILRIRKDKHKLIYLDGFVLPEQIPFGKKFLFATMRRKILTAPQ